MTVMRIYCLLVLLACSAMATVEAQVDSATASLKGTILDPQGLPIPEAHVTLVNESTGSTAEAVTTKEGYFIPAIKPGSYRLEAAASGFAESYATHVVLSVGELATLDMHLRLQGPNADVEVRAEPSMAHPDQVQQANIINSVQIENLPNISRNFAASVYTVPGVSNSYAPTLQDPGVGTAYLSSGFSIGASNGRNNLVTIDGGENEYGSGTMRDTHVPLDSIQEFQINRNSFEAAFGFTSGTAINMVTKSGTSQLHGNVAAYLNNRTIDAGDYFDKLAANGHKPFEQGAIFSASLGGPIPKSRLFFFTAPEYQKLDASTVQNIAGEQEFQSIASQSNGYNGNCPNQDAPGQQVTQLCYLTQMANAGGPVGALGSALLTSPVFGDPLNDPILNALVARNDGTFDGILASPGGSGVRGLPGFNTPRGRYLNWVTRFDLLHGKDTFGLRIATMHETDSVVPRPPYSSDESQADVTVTGSWTRVLNAKLFNTVLVQAVPSNTESIVSPAPLGSEIDLGNQIQLGSPFAYPYHAKFRRFQFDDSLSWASGSHLVRAGISWRPDDYYVQEKVWFGGEWQFTDGTFSIYNLAGPAAQQLSAFNLSRGYPAQGPPSTNLTAVQSFLAGTPTLLLQANADSNSAWTGWANLVGLFVQDSWKMLPSVTLDYGLRLDYDREPSPVPHSTRFSPRVGIAWAPGQDSKTVVRAGGGLFVAPGTFLVPFYSNLLGDSGHYINQNALVAGLPSPPFPSIFAAWQLQRSNATPAQPNPTLTAAQLASLGMHIVPPGPSAFGNFIYTVSHGFEPAYTVQASLSIARQVSSNLSLELAYLMYHSVHVEQALEANFAVDAAAPVDPFVGPLYAPKAGETAGEPNSSIFQNNAFSSVGSGIYHGGTISLTRRWDHGFQFQANYTFSRALDDTSDFSSLSVPFRPGFLNLDYGVSDFNITHNFVVNGVFALPSRFRRGSLAQRIFADITISPIVFARSGVPFTALVPGLVNGTIGHNANARPWHERRNNGNGPAFVSGDLRLSKAITWGDTGRTIEFIAQAQNVGNHTNFAQVNNNFPANPTYTLPRGGTLENGPYNLTGFAPKSVSQLSQPLSFTASYPARRISLALRFAF